MSAGRELIYVILTLSSQYTGSCTFLRIVFEVYNYKREYCAVSTLKFTSCMDESAVERNETAHGNKMYYQAQRNAKKLHAIFIRCWQSVFYISSPILIFAL